MFVLEFEGVGAKELREWCCRNGKSVDSFGCVQEEKGRFERRSYSYSSII
jgi:hypothetical protein